MKIGIIGCGFVGSAIHHAYSIKGVTCCISDPAKGFLSSKNQLMECEGIFICVPSPSLPSGACDTSILESVVEEYKEYKGVLISKVTAPPDVYTKLQRVTNRLVYAPEFLTAANAKQDYLNSKFLVIGGDSFVCNTAADIIKPSMPEVEKIVYSRIEEASMMKYTINCFLASKVAFMNELFLLCHKEAIDYSVVARLVTLDERIGSSHMQVPGPDGLMGFGGACFPKDTKALSNYARDKKSVLKILETVINTNNKLRAEEST